MFTREEKRKIIEGKLLEICSTKGIAVGEQTRFLDAVFSETFTGSDCLFARVALIEKFESNYPELLTLSDWYKGNLQQFSDYRRDYDELTHTVNKLRFSPPDNRMDWKKLAAQFRAVPGRAEIYATPGPESGDELWHVKRSQEVKQPYEALAKRGLKALGLSGGAKGMEAWYSLLRLHSSLSKHQFEKHSYGIMQFALVNWGKIKPLCIASAEYCESLAASGATLNRELEVIPAFRSKRPLQSPEKQRSLFSGTPEDEEDASSASQMPQSKKPGTRILYMPRKGPQQNSSPAMTNLFHDGSGCINEDSIAKIVSTQERLEAILTQLAEKNERVKPGKVSKQYPRDFEGLSEKQVSLYIADAPLTDMQSKCARLKWDYCLGDSEIARRLGRSRATIKEHLEAARKKMDNLRSSARRIKRIKSPIEQIR